MKIMFRICDATGWQTIIAATPDGSDVECYALAKGADRWAFWEAKIGRALPKGRAMIWCPVQATVDASQ